VYTIFCLVMNVFQRTTTKIKYLLQYPRWKLKFLETYCLQKLNDFKNAKEQRKSACIKLLILFWKVTTSWMRLDDLFHNQNLFSNLIWILFKLLRRFWYPLWKMNFFIKTYSKIKKSFLVSKNQWNLEFGYGSLGFRTQNCDHVQSILEPQKDN